MNLRYRDMIILIGIIGIVLMMVVPLPMLLLDFLLILNISVGTDDFARCDEYERCAEFSIFPALLLVTTLFRLALNVSTTRMILGEADAGKVIHTFGDFVAGGQLAVGFIVFLILVVVQFIVITKGAERVAEVGARFTLDAMPGKQMSIDADLNAGMINEQEARARREKIEQEADFYGAMDGASKFIKGDAIVGIVILFINMIGGLMIGMTVHGMSLQESLTTFTKLTIGDGLVTQIPALLLSTADRHDRDARCIGRQSWTRRPVANISFIRNCFTSSRAHCLCLVFSLRSDPSATTPLAAAAAFARMEDAKESGDKGSRSGRKQEEAGNRRSEKPGKRRQPAPGRSDRVRVRLWPHSRLRMRSRAGICSTESS